MLSNVGNRSQFELNPLAVAPPAELPRVLVANWNGYRISIGSNSLLIRIVLQALHLHPDPIPAAYNPSSLREGINGVPMARAASRFYTPGLSSSRDLIIGIQRWATCIGAQRVLRMDGRCGGL